MVACSVCNHVEDPDYSKTSIDDAFYFVFRNQSMKLNLLLSNSFPTLPDCTVFNCIACVYVLNV